MREHGWTSWSPRRSPTGVRGSRSTASPWPTSSGSPAASRRWDDWCAAWVAAGSEHEALGRDALAEGRHRSAGEHLAQAAVYYHFAKFVFVEDLDQMRAAHARAVACLDDALPHLDPPGRRIEMPFERQPAGRRPPAACRRRSAPGRRPDPRARLHQGGAPLDRGRRSSTAGWRPSRSTAPARARRSTTCRSAATGRPVAETLLGHARRAARDRPHPARRLGRQPRWLLRAAGRGRARRPGHRLRRAGRPLQLRRVLGRPAAADPRHLPGALRRGRPTRRRARSRSPSAWRPSPADLVAPLLIVFGRLDRLIPWEQRRPAARRRGRTGRAADARGRQPRLRQRRALAPPPHRRLAGRPARRRRTPLTTLTAPKAG